MMKLILFFFFIAVLAIGCYAVEKRKDDKWPPKEILETFRPIAKVCQEHTGVTHESIREFDLGEIHDDPALKCYMYCLFKEAKSVDEHGEVHLELLQVHIDNLDREIQNIAINMGKKCIYPEGETLCDRAWWFHKCWKTADPKHYFLYDLHEDQ